MDQLLILLSLLQSLTQSQILQLSILLQLLSQQQLDTPEILSLFMQLFQSPLPQQLHYELHNSFLQIQTSQQKHLPLINLIQTLTQQQLLQLYELSQLLKLHQPQQNLFQMLNISLQLLSSLPLQLRKELERLLDHLQLFQLHKLLNSQNNDIQIENQNIQIENQNIQFDDNNRPRKKFKSI